jgi:HPt (histidine-containing phosphotransfer) domain-containing protein
VPIVRLTHAAIPQVIKVVNSTTALALFEPVRVASNPVGPAKDGDSSTFLAEAPRWHNLCRSMGRQHDRSTRLVPVDNCRQVALMSNRKPCDMSFARSRVGGDPDLLRQIVEIVHADMPAVLDRLRAAVATGNRKELLLAVHSLQGMLVTFDAEAALSALRSLAETGQAGDLSETREALRDFEGEASRFNAELSAELEKSLIR